MGIPILLDEKLLVLGICEYIRWFPNQAPHAVIFGSTGSGKTYCCLLLLGKIALYEPDSQLYICDFKGDDDFEFLNGCPRFYKYNLCADGLQDFFNQFKERQNGNDKSRHMLVLYFDEWAAYCNNIEDKKTLESEKRKLASLLMLGRSFNVHVIVSQQRVDAVYFNTARDNFNLVIGLGNLSEEAKNMLFHEFKKNMLPDRQRGTGYMLTNGANLTPILVPAIRNWEKLHETIKRGVNR